MRSTFLRAYPPAQPAEGETRWLLFRNGDLLVRAEGDQIALIADRAALADAQGGEPIYLGTLDGVPYIACALAGDDALPEGWQPRNLRTLFGALGDEEYGIAGFASQMLFWQRTSQFCPVCGSPTEHVGGDWGRRCTSCGFSRYPQISPAILALVSDGDRILLTHKPGWGARYSIVAGFVEPNEALEDCVQREVMEECGVDVAGVTYFGSQGWPFPAQLMVGFTCTYAGGELAIDPHELDDARWFHVDDMPELPGPLSLSRQLIDHWVSSRKQS